MSHCSALALEITGFAQGLLPPWSQCTFEYYKKYEVKMTRISLNFIIDPSCERALKNRWVKLKIGNRLWKWTFGQDRCLISDFARSNSNKVVLVQVLRSIIVIYNNNFVFSMMISFCSMTRVAGWIFAREIIKCTNMFYPYF